MNAKLIHYDQRYHNEPQINPSPPRPQSAARSFYSLTANARMPALSGHNAGGRGYG